MYTRTSPRNQEILWRALTPPAPAVEKVAAPSRCWDCANYPKGGRSTGTCKLLAMKVGGERLGCDAFKAR